MEFNILKIEKGYLLVYYLSLINLTKKELTKGVEPLLRKEDDYNILKYEDRLGILPI